ncbi:unnamed protein product, partial [Durusdinium trenchii]
LSLCSFGSDELTRLITRLASDAMQKRHRFLAVCVLAAFGQVSKTYLGSFRRTVETLRETSRTRPSSVPRRQAAFDSVAEMASDAVENAAASDLLAILGGSLSWIYVFLLGGLTLVAGLGQIFQMEQEDEFPGVRFGLGDRVAAEALKRREELEEGVEIVEDEAGDDFRQEVVDAEARGWKPQSERFMMHQQ